MHKYVRYVPPYAAAAELGQSKAARENLHDTTMAVDSILNYPLKPKPPLVIDFSPKEKATNFFADTICEFSEQLTPEELYQALLDAMESYYLNTKKEFDHATQLRDLITGFKND
tara:strand:- start:9 stop:350 length:342 start_codon:yes stop_codon:yes gene_type:complete